MNKFLAFFKKPFFSDFRTLFGLWMLLPVVAWIVKLHHCNNYFIYRGSFWNAARGWNIYMLNPAEYEDCHHYGPFFSLLFAPFAVGPYWVGLLLWGIALSMFLYWAIRSSTFTKPQQLFILWFCANELLNALFMQQFNIAVVATILLAFCLIEKEKDFWAAFFIMLGVFVKLYSIVGLAFFFFSKHKGKFVASLLFWAVVMFVAPMPFFHGWDYIVSQYGEWYHSLVTKNGDNQFAIAQNISLLGMVRKISGCATYSDLWIIVPGLLLFAAPYLRFSQWKHVAFRQTLLASVLMFVILFSTGSENSGYITPMIGVVIWYVAAPWKRSKWDVVLMVYVMLCCSFAHSDLFPRPVRDSLIRPYALKALPVTIVWLKLCWEMLTKDYASQEEASSLATR
jgi:hypothetical protein